ncbi:MAG: nucleotidyl transferase AbiEii/AbiGii toxin family protein [Chitinophagaceae bacterium]|nr:MAG: nucleotidyl transferase AbiEii/AbiGii toxin family protein [Chitinophagaceae bacterium]
MLHKQTTSPELFQVLKILMSLPELSSFRLVGGTALSLLRGHRISEDIDMFTDQTYGTTDFVAIEQVIKEKFPVVDNYADAFPRLKAMENNLGLYLYVGSNEQDLIKTDILYWDAPFLFGALAEEGIRLASVEEIGAMKLDVISRGGRKKDFWDLVEILPDYSLPHLLRVYKEKYPYNDLADVKRGLSDFLAAEEGPDPICLRKRTWESVKEVIIRQTAQL